MKKIIFTAGLLLIAGFSFAQVESFENVTLDSGKVLNGKAGELEYTFQVQGFTNLHLPVFYDTSSGGYWASGWALSRKYDSATVASDAVRHLYCAKTFKGADTSNTFAIGQSGSFLYQDRGSNPLIYGFFITNTTYAYNSMKFGDAFAKKFGGASENDSDYFFCRVRGYMQGKQNDSQDIYLADFRFTDNSKDYILREWKHVYLPLCDSVSFELFSSDTSVWGINTPAFFALDAIEYGFRENVNQHKRVAINLYPNPAKDVIQIQSSKPILSYRIFDLSGKMLQENLLNGAVLNAVNTNALNNGTYLLQLQTTDGTAVERIQIFK